MDSKRESESAARLRFMPVFETPLRGGRVLEHCPTAEALLASCEDSHGAGGISKFSLRDPSCTATLAALHAKPIRGICANEDASLVLSVGFDKCAKLTNISSFNTVMSCGCPSPLWSCCWDSADSNCFYVGRADGSVSLYDTRNTQSFVWTAAGPTRCPVHSLVSLPPQKDGECGSLLAGTLEGVFAMTRSHASSAKHSGISVRGTCIGVSRAQLCQDNKRMLLAASFRSTPPQLATHHKIIGVAPPAMTADEDVAVVEELQCIVQESFTQHMSRPALLRSATSATVSSPTLFLLTSMEPSCKVAVWDVESGSLLAGASQQQCSQFSSQSSSQQLAFTTKPLSPALDICPFVKQSTAFLAIASQAQLSILSPFDC